MRVAPSVVALTCLALSASAVSACSASDRASQTLPPLPIVVRATVALPTGATVAVSATSAPTASPAATPAATTVAGPTTTTATTVTSVATGDAGTTTIQSSDASVAGSESLQTWIMQLGSVSATATAQAVAAFVGQLSQISAGVKTLKSSDWPAVFQGQDRIIFYVGSFSSRDAVIARCAALGLAYPAKCLARFMTSG